MSRSGRVGLAVLVVALGMGGGGPIASQMRVPTVGTSAAWQGITLRPVAARINKAVMLRKGPADNRPIIAKIPAGTMASVLSSKEGWHELDVTVQGKSVVGWAPYKVVVVDVESAASNVPMVGRLTAGVNVRSGPGIANPVIGKGEPGQEVSLLSTRNGWYEVIGSFGDNLRSGWVRHDFVAVDVQARHWAAVNQTQVKTLGGATSSPVGTSSDLLKRPLGPQERRVIYSGYSERYLPLKAEIRRGRFELAADKFEKLGKVAAAKAPSLGSGSNAEGDADTLQERDARGTSEPIRTDGFLKAVELGTMALDSGAFSTAVERFAAAEDAIIEKKTQSKKAGFFSNLLGRFAETLSGDEEIVDYRGEGYERVLMLNYKAIAFLLQGDRRAYNVTRRAIDWQNIEKRAFEARVREAKSKLGDLERESKKEGGAYDGSSIQDALAGQYASLDARASSVPSAYVNPFGFYVAGMVLEFESYKDITQRDNARISYKKALDLNPQTTVLRQAVADLSKPVMRRDKRLVHIIVADGFAPEKKTLMYGLLFRGQVVPVKLPIYEPVPTEVRRIEVRSMDDKTLQVLSILADIEAIALRHQKDSQPFQNLRVGIAVVRSVLEKSVLSQLGQLGTMLGNIRDATTTPDMRAWMSLPATIKVGRIFLARNVDRIQLVAFGSGGRELARKTVSLGKTIRSFVYARSVGGNLFVRSSGKLWVDE